MSAQRGKRGLLQRIRARFARWNARRQLLGPKMLREFARQRPEAFFIEIGANDGKMMDPLRATILASAWRGLLVEPVPHLFGQLAENYRPLQGRVTPVNAAVGGSDGPLAFYCLADSPGSPPLPAWAHGLGSFRRDVVLKHRDRIPDIERYVAAITVPSLTWASLCERHHVAAVDLLMIDTEGYDHEILGQLDFVRWRPSLLIFEHHHLEAPVLGPLDQRLRAAGYFMFREGLDTWCIDTRADAFTREFVAALPGRVAGSRYGIAV